MNDILSHKVKWLESIDLIDEPEYYKNYKRSQIYLSFGDYTKCLQLLQIAWKDAQSVKNDTIWETVYYNIGGSYATICDYMGDVNSAETAFDIIMSIRPTGFYIGDYAVFLHRTKRVMEKAYSFYNKALEIYPNNSNIHLKYAGFLRHVYKDLKRADIHYQRACDTNPNNSDALGSYASFLHGVIGNLEQAEIFYEKSYTCDDTHANNLCNYGLFLSEIKKNFNKAESLYKRVLEVTSNHANTLYNYAVMLDTHCNRKLEAEDLYRRCISFEPRHAYALYNLAVLLEEKSNKYDNNGLKFTEVEAEIKSMREEISSLYQRTVEIDPNDPVTTADCGRYYLLKIGNIEEAEKYLLKSVVIDSKNETGLFHLGILHHKFKVNFKKAYSYYNSLIEISPKHSGALQYLARLLIDYAVKKEESNIKQDDIDQLSNKSKADLISDAMDIYEKAMLYAKDAASIIIEYVSSIAKHGNNKQKLRAISTTDAVTKKLGINNQTIKQLYSNIQSSFLNK